MPRACKMPVSGKTVVEDVFGVPVDPVRMAAASQAGRIVHDPAGEDVVAEDSRRAYLRFTWHGPCPQQVWLRLDDGRHRRIPAVAISGSSDRWVFRARVEAARPAFAYQAEVEWLRVEDGGLRQRLLFGPREGGEGGDQAVGRWQVDLSRRSAYRVPRWVRESVMYQIFPDRFYNGQPANDPEGTVAWDSAPTLTSFFGGDLEGILRRLDYLADLGIGAVYLNPIVAAPSNHRYDASDYLKVDPALGTCDDLRRLAEAMHRRGMRLILDAVFNHTGETHWAFQDVIRKGPDSPYYSWYFIHSWPITRDPPSYACWWGLPHLPKLNTATPAVREHLFAVTRFWMELGADGWRLDVPNEIEGDFWQQWRRLVKSIKPDAYIVGEIWHDAREWLQGDQFDGVMNYVLRDALLNFFVVRSITGPQLAQILGSQWERYPAPALFSLMNLLGSHDTERILTAAGGERRAVQAMMLWLLAYPGIPSIYYGDEVGMTGARDPDCRRGFPWDEMRQDVRMFRWVRRLIRIRRSLPVLTHGEVSPVKVEGSLEVSGFARVLPGSAGPGAAALCLASRSPEPQTVVVRLAPGVGVSPAEGKGRPVVWVDLLTGRPVGSGRRLTLQLGPWGTALLASAPDRRRAAQLVVALT